MARETTLKCDFCGQEIEQVASKVYLAPVLPGKSSTSFMSGYSHWADICAECLTNKFLPHMTKRKSNNNGSQASKNKATKKKSRA